MVRKRVVIAPDVRRGELWAEGFGFPGRTIVISPRSVSRGRGLTFRDGDEVVVVDAEDISPSDRELLLWALWPCGLPDSVAAKLR